ncbi:hypothetical protein [Sunxiuqinia elliptica]|uniref:Uncharacterized protein n=1 Tax=Sunxiuqinia elliptica TaxID=655355 RepID=A0A1I2CNB2_9BACT|nr:hypothetical protein [Sunxiuqinia elliptica]SFE69811.1 hypothetical protein SAMN05216283_101784 [Sunxiuqinia elliptica]
MNKRLLNKLMMLKAVLSFLKANARVWKQVPDLADDIKELGKLTNEIDSKRQLIANDTKGHTEEKRDEQQKLEKQVIALSSVLAAMAERSGNEVLLGKVDFSRSEFTQKRDQEQVIIASEIVALARENLEALASSAISEEQVAELESQAKRVEQLMPKKRLSVSERKAANGQMKELFKTTDRLLKKRIDRMIVPYESSDPAFYAAYQNARMIIDYGTRYNKEETGETA